MSERYERRGPLGRGSSGIVLRAFDQVLGQEVALKVLASRSPAELARLKREFRTVAEVTHPNLVELYDLEVEGDGATIGMELLDGPTLLEACRPFDEPEHGAIRQAFRDLAQGLLALHHAGVVHRDLSPRNVRLDGSGCAKLLDFGLGHRVADGARGAPAGTLPYLAPETLLGEVGPAADWYAAGVLLFEALTGGRPFSDDLAEAMVEKQQGRIRDPDRLADAPEDLRQATLAWLAPDPRARPGAEAILGPEDHRRDTARAEAPAPLFGRQRELDALRACIEDGRRATDGPGWALVRGPSGIGKTRLVQEALGGRGALHSRCHPREHLQYNALDSVIDQIVDRLADFPPELTGDERIALGRLFPTMRRLYPISAEEPSPFEPRARAVNALAKLLAEVDGRSGGTVLWIDDGQWMDADSAELLRALLRSERPIPALVVTSRQEAGAGLRALTREHAPRLELSLAPLPPSALDAMIAALRPDLEEAERQAYGRACEGNPFVATRLCAEDGDTAARLGSLAPAATEVFELVAVAGQPIELDLLRIAVGSEGLATVTSLRKSRLLRPLDRGDERLVTYHDRIRESFLDQLSPGRSLAAHQRLVDAFFADGAPDPDRVIAHLLAIEDPRSCDYALRAAEAAFERLAFARAAELYRAAVRLEPEDPRVPEWRERAAMCHGHLGQALLASEQLSLGIAALGPTDHDRRLRLTRMRAEYLLSHGYVDRGRAATEEMLRQVGMRMPARGLRALGSLLVERARLRISREGPVRADHEISPEELARLDAMRVATTSLSILFPIEASALATRLLREAARVGDRYNLTLALALEANMAANLGGPREHARTDAVLRRMERLVEAYGGNHERAWLTATRGTVHLCRGRPRQCVDLHERSLAMVEEERRRGVLRVTEKDFVRSYAFTLPARAYLGEIRTLDALLAERLEVAEQRKDLQHQESCLHGQVSLVHLALDRPARVREQTDRALRTWPVDDFGIAHYHHLLTMSPWALYTDRVDEGWDVVAREWPRAKRAQFLRMEMVGSELRHARGRLALGMARAHPGRQASYLDITREDERALSRTSFGYTVPFTATLSAGRLSLEGRRAASLEAVREARDGYRAIGMQLHASVADWVLDAHGQGADWLAAQGVADPARMSEALFPATVRP